MNHYYLYLDRKTWLHALEPRTKILSLLGFFVMALTFSDPVFLILPLLIILLLFLTARSMENVRKIRILLVLLFFYCVVLWPFFVVGHTPVFSRGNLIITWEGLLFGIGMGLRVSLMLLGGILLLSTTKIEEFMFALQRLGLPAHIGFALSMAFRWVPNLLGSIGAIIQAQRARGLDLTATSLFDRIRRYPPLLVPLFGHQFRQTKLLAMALEAKGFGPGIDPTHFGTSSMQGRDYLIILITSIVVSLCLWLRMQGIGIINVEF